MLLYIFNVFEWLSMIRTNLRLEWWCSPHWLPSSLHWHLLAIGRCHQTCLTDRLPCCHCQGRLWPVASLPYTTHQFTLIRRWRPPMRTFNVTFIDSIIFNVIARRLHLGQDACRLCWADTSIVPSIVSGGKDIGLPSSWPARSLIIPSVLSKWWSMFTNMATERTQT